MYRIAPPICKAIICLYCVSKTSIPLDLFLRIKCCGNYEHKFQFPCFFPNKKEGKICFSSSSTSYTVCWGIKNQLK